MDTKKHPLNLLDELSIVNFTEEIKESIEKDLAEHAPASGLR